MRDLKKDKAMCNAEITETPGAYTIDVEELEKGFYMWRERALKAEAERCIGETECYFNLKNQIEQLQTENAELRKVVEAARDVVGFGACHDENSLWSIKALQNTIENYEGWKKEGREVNEI